MRFLLGKGLGDPVIDYYLAEGERNKGIISNCRYKVWFGFEEKEGEEANSAQTTGFFGVNMGIRGTAVETGETPCDWMRFQGSRLERGHFPTICSPDETPMGPEHIKSF